MVKVLFLITKKIHESDSENQRVTIQLRFKELNNSFKFRGINQVIDSKIKKYWINNYNVK